MPRATKISRLPETVRAHIDERLGKDGFEDFDGLAAELQAQGHDINSNNLYRHWRKLRTEIAQAEKETEAQRAFRRLKGELERAGIRLHARDEPVQRLLTELGVLRLRERVLLARLSAVADLAEIGRINPESGRTATLHQPDGE